MQRKAILLVGSQKNVLFNLLRKDGAPGHVETIGIDMLAIDSEETKTQFQVWIQVGSGKSFGVSKPNSIMVLCPGDKEEKRNLIENQQKGSLSGMTSFVVAVEERLHEGKDILLPGDKSEAVKFLDEVLKAAITVKPLLRSQTERKEVEVKPALQKSKSLLFWSINKLVSAKREKNILPGFAKKIGLLS